MIAFVFLISQGCMPTNIIGGGQEGREERSKAVRPNSLLDKSPRIDTQGEVIIEIRFAGLTFGGNLAFNVEIAPLVKLGQYSLNQMSTLASDLGTRVQASRWEVSLIVASGDYLTGVIYFPAQDALARPLISKDVRNLTLNIKNLAGIPERVFRWNISPGHRGREN